MALPLLSLSRPALEDDDELQESTEGMLSKLRGAQGKKKKNRISPGSDLTDYESQAWKDAAAKAGICRLPIALGNRMLQFKSRFDKLMGQQQHELNIGLCIREGPLALESDVVSVSSPTYPPDVFHAVFYDSNSVRSKSRTLVVHFKLSYDANGDLVYGSMASKSGAPADLYRKYDTAFQTIIETIAAFVGPMDARKAPNDFEKVYDPDPRRRTLARFLRG
jgi:hypothetical protein